MEPKKIVGGIYSDVSDQVTQICETCKWATPIKTMDDVICTKKGIVKADNCCKLYEYNRLLKKNHKKRRSRTEFSEEDFSID